MKVQVYHSAISMPGWTLVDTHSTQGRTFQRPLDVSELAFALDGRFNGTADNLHHVQVRPINGFRDANLFADSNIVRAWVSAKRRYPLVAATVHGPGTSKPLGVATESKTDVFASEHHFVVREHDLTTLRPGEIVFGQVADAEDAQRRADVIMDGPRPLSDELLAQLYVFRETDSEDVLHLMTLIAHCVTDGAANRTFMRCFLDTLARDGGLDSEPAQISLEERLAMAISPLDVQPVHLCSLSLARRRWRKAVGIVIYQLRVARMQGGHTLPCRLTRSTPFVAARARIVSTSLMHTQSADVLANCRSHDITFGHAYRTLAQVAMTRVLYRRYLRGEISEEEWLYRKRQPHISGASLNLRPYLDRTWFDSGGGGELVLSIGFFVVQLPFMTLGATEEQHQDRERDPERVPSGGAIFSDLLTFERFLHRARLVKNQTRAFFSHPLFFEIVYAAHLKHLELTQFSALHRMKRSGEGVRGDSDLVLEIKKIPVIRAHGGSSLGNMDLMLPSEYPLLPTHSLSPCSSAPHPNKAGYVIPPSSSPSPSNVVVTPKIAVEYSRTRLHPRPAELYLGAATWRGQLNMYVSYDGNVFEEGVVKEWLDDVKEAMLWYLGQKH